MTIKQIQSLLCYLGLLTPGDIDNICGSKTALAVKAFQRKTDLNADGIPGPMTEKMLKHVVAYGYDTPDTPTDSEWPFKHFARSEFACKCGCGFDDINPHVVKIMEDLREQFGGKDYIVSSGCRCKKHNSSLKNSVPNSRHLVGDAADGAIVGVPSYTLCLAARKHPDVHYAYAIDNDFVHIDIKER